MALASFSHQEGANATTIANATIACRKSLKQCTEIEALKQYSWAENRLADFNIWDSGLAACSSGQASLENRLILKPQVRSAVLSLLLLYQQSVNFCIDLGLLHDERGELNNHSETTGNTSVDDADPTSEGSTGDQELTLEDTTLPEAIEHADLVLNDLARLAVLIRKAGATSHLSKADRTFNRLAPHHTKLENHLLQLLVPQPSRIEDRRNDYWETIDLSLDGTHQEESEAYQAHAERGAISFLRDHRAFTEIETRLVVANLRRSHRFAYSRDHGRRLMTSLRTSDMRTSSGIPIGTDSGIKVPLSKRTVPLGHKTDSIDQDASFHRNLSIEPEHVAEEMTLTAASDVNTMAFNKAAKLPTPSCQAVTEISTTGSRIRYPKPPRYKEGAAIFTCPCCCVPLPVIFAEPRHWMNHLKEDILPYSCVLPNCSVPDVLYADKEAWLEHMFDDHLVSTSWGCEICGDAEMFPSEADFVAHLTELHLDAIPAKELDLFVDAGSRQTVEELSSCPLCSWAQDTEGVVSNDQLLEHIAEHIHSFALRSLPWAPDRIDYNQGVFRSSVEKVETWLSICNPGAETFGYKPTLQTEESDMNQDNYFYRHEYFAESSKASSRALAESSGASSSAASLSSFTNDECDYNRRHIHASESRGSEDESSIHKVKGLGFEAAAASFSALFHTNSGCESVISSPLEAVFEEWRFRRSSQPRDPSESTRILSDLQRRIEGSLAFSRHDDEDFLPLDSFESIFNAKTIALLLDESYNFATVEELGKKFESIVDQRSGRSRRRTLGVLVLMSQVAHIEHFIREDIWDDDLPLERSVGSGMGCVRTRDSKNDTLMKNWGRIEINDFCSYQKMFFVPFFDIQDHRLCSYELESNIRLPWKKFEHKINGGFGVIHKVEIHPSHHNFPVSNSSSEPVFALKAIEAGDHKAYKEELAALEKTCVQVHKEKHLIKLLLTFRHGEKFFLLFEWADGNLGEFWKLHATRPSTPLGELWAARQCLGLARAVSRIHGLTTWQKIGRSASFGSLDDAERDWGRHGDIKPENILWFKEYGTDHNLLVISDLGLTRYHSRFSKSFVPRSHIDGCSWAYRPPELDIEERISQKYDIWSLGCVFLEFAVWYLQGHYEVEAFSFQREDEDLVTFEGVKIEKFFNIHSSEDGRRKPHLKQVVKDRLRELNNLSNATTFTKGLLYVIEHKMLQCAPDERGKIDVICVELSSILESIQQVEVTDDVAQGLRSRLSQDLAYIRRDDSAPSLRAPRDISLYEELRESATDDDDIMMVEESDPGLLMRTRSRRSRRDNSGKSEGRRVPAPETYRHGIPGLHEASTIADTTRETTRHQSAAKDSRSERAELPQKDANSPHGSSQPPSTDGTNRVERRGVSRWFRDTIKQVRPGRK